MALTVIFSPRSIWLMGDMKTDSGCRVTREWLGTAVILRVAGVIDMLTAPCLESALAGCLEEKPAAMVVDLSDTEFLASAGIGALIHARTQAGDVPVGFAVVADSPATSRPLRLLGLDGVLNLHATVDEALASF